MGQIPRRLGTQEGAEEPCVPLASFYAVVDGVASNRSSYKTPLLTDRSSKSIQLAKRLPTCSAVAIPHIALVVTSCQSCGQLTEFESGFFQCSLPHFVSVCLPI